MKVTRSSIVVLLLAAIAAVSVSAADRRPLAAVDFFGYKGLDLAAVRAALPFHEGDSFPPAKGSVDGVKRQVRAAVKQVIGREPTDIVFVCCDSKQQYGAFIGLPGQSYQPWSSILRPPAVSDFRRMPSSSATRWTTRSRTR